MRTLIAAALFVLVSDVAVVPMSDEPFHRLVFENKTVAVYDVVLPPKGLMRFHAHPTNHLAIVIDEGVMQNEVVGKAPFKNPTGPQGSVIYLEAGPAHRQSNIGAANVHFVAVELLAAPPKDAVKGGETRASTPIEPGCKVGVDVAQVRVWRCLAKPGETIAPHTEHKFLRIPLVAGTLGGSSGSVLKAGEPVWREAAETETLTNTGTAALSFVDIEVK